MQTYMLSIEMPWRQVSQAIRAQDDRHAAKIAAEIVAATCADVSELGDYRACLQSSNGCNVFEPMPISALIENVSAGGR